MIILDILFKICFGPFQKVENGRYAAIIFLIQILGSSVLALINVLLFIVGINLSSIGLAITGMLAGIGVYFLFNTIYVKNNRNLTPVKFPLLMGVLIFILMMSSLFLMIISLARY